MHSFLPCVWPPAMPFSWRKERKKQKKNQERTLGQQKDIARQQTPFCDIQMVIILLLANISIPYRYLTTENLSDLDFDLSRSLKVKSDGVIRLMYRLTNVNFELLYMHVARSK